MQGTLRSTWPANEGFFRSENKAHPATSGRMNNKTDSGLYVGAAILVGSVIFSISLLYAIRSYGFFLGAGLGWIPSLVFAVVAGFLWPLIAFGLMALGGYYLHVVYGAGMAEIGFLAVVLMLVVIIFRKDWERLTAPDLRDEAPGSPEGGDT